MSWSTSDHSTSGRRVVRTSPALLIKMSTPPSSSSTWAAKASMPSRSARSIVHARESGEDTRQSASTPSSRSRRRAQIPTTAPAPASSRAMAAPIPDEAPVTSTRFPARSSATPTPVVVATSRRSR